MEESCVTFKATVNGLIINMKEDDDFKTIKEHIDKKVASAGKFFRGATLAVKYRGKSLSREEENVISILLSEKTGAEIKSFEKETAVPKEKPAPVPKTTDKLKMKKYFFKGIEEGMTKFHQKTVRSGQLISFDGNLVIIGDVNPGAELVATGNVIVMGSLRGTVHAGSDGNRDVIVVAYNLNPQQLRIADVVTRNPDEKKRGNTTIPELAYVKDDKVYIENFLPQR